MKNLNLIAIIFITSFSYGQNTWDGSNSTTTTNGTVVVTNGNLGIGTSSSTNRFNINSTSNSIGNNFSSTLNNGFNGSQSGLSNITTFSGTGTKQSIYNAFTFNSASSTEYGFRNEGISTGTGAIYSIYNAVNKTSTNGIVYGILNNISSSSSNDSYGISTNLFGNGNGKRYGFRANMIGLSAGSGDRYGFYADMLPGGTGNRYGIYSVAIGTGAKSGYFQGDLELNQGNMVYSSSNGNRTLVQNTPTTGQYSFSITPNATNNLDDWQWSRSFIIDRNGEMVKRCNSVGKVFSVSRFDLSQDVFRVYGDGKVYATEVNVMLSSAFPDYVFKPTYNLMPLTEVKEYIKENGHLPNVPSAEIIEIEGMNLGETTRVLVEKVEELTLYIIQLQTEIEALKKVTTEN